MKLVCVDDETDILKIGDGVKELTWGKQYNIENVYEDINIEGGVYVSIINDKGVSNDYFIKRFITLEEFRDLKLNKLGFI
jgi:hypothetical protein